jgi:hypothetical protein
MDTNLLFKKDSSRHHYIPKFLIKGFANQHGQLYVYDKLKNKILDKPQFPKQIFFEKDRNTIEVKPGLETTFLEDIHYFNVDNKACKSIQAFQNDPLNKINYSIENLGYLSYFLIALYWRIPANDDIALHLYKNSEFKNKDIDIEVLKNDPVFQKLEQSRLSMHTIEHIKLYGKKIFSN